jgi:hypothetical protein
MRALFLCSLVLLTACGEPHKPKGVPADSFWIGPRKTGVFVKVGQPVGAGWHLTIYDRKRGTVKAEGTYLLLGPARAEFMKEDFAGWDGQNILLTDGGRLVPKP